MPSGVRIFAISGTLSRQKLCGRSSTTSRANSNTSGFRGSFGPRFRLARVKPWQGGPPISASSFPIPATSRMRSPVTFRTSPKMNDHRTGVRSGGRCSPQIGTPGSRMVFPAFSWALNALLPRLLEGLVEPVVVLVGDEVDPHRPLAEVREVGHRRPDVALDGADDLEPCQDEPEGESPRLPRTDPPLSASPGPVGPGYPDAAGRERVVLGVVGTRNQESARGIAHRAFGRRSGRSAAGPRVGAFARRGRASFVPQGYRAASGEASALGSTEWPRFSTPAAFDDAVTDHDTEKADPWRRSFGGADGASAPDRTREAWTFVCRRTRQGSGQATKVWVTASFGGSILCDRRVMRPGPVRARRGRPLDRRWSPLHADAWSTPRPGWPTGRDPEPAPACGDRPGRRTAPRR